MANSGELLENLVSSVERILLQKGFDVETRKRVFNDDGTQIAEFDVIVSGKLGSTQIEWLIECRDRPSDGPAPGSWIEQLVGRRNRFGFNKVTAVSTTGFSKNAIDYANESGIELREVSDSSKQAIEDWFQVEHMTLVHNKGDLTSVQIFLANDVSQQQESEFQNLLKTVSSEDKVLIHIDTKNDLSILDAWQGILNQQKQIFDGVDPGGEPKHISIIANYQNPESRYAINLNEELIHVEQIHFEANLTASLEAVPIHRITQYSQNLNKASLAQSVHYRMNIDKKKMNLAITRVEGENQTYLVLSQTEGGNRERQN
ncbi:MAG: hypothetical protein DWQ07_10245 [Chloroflexi bacterium]|nr:MAG: hypothetical protein DWQ07_10245 [Chloroflexota bacterium]MBL1192909.1 hypothetical protein [Chloroflexota bacterium]NOH10202.1 hypothetical protein [Chloroflexota bacterium]